MRTYIYVVGFNFYYGAVKNTPYKWLDFKTFFEKLLNPKHQILSIKYFTSMVSGKFDPDQPVRQKTFIRAIKKYIPELSVYYGSFTTHEVIKTLVYNGKKYKNYTFEVPVYKTEEKGSDEVIKPLVYRGKKYKDYTFKVPVYKTEEKGSDVNLAIHLLNDAWKGDYDCAVVVSNDSDLAESLKLIPEFCTKIQVLVNTN